MRVQRRLRGPQGARVQDPSDPELVTPDERLAEVGRLLAAGYLRHRAARRPTASSLSAEEFPTEAIVAAYGERLSRKRIALALGDRLARATRTTTTPPTGDSPRRDLRRLLKRIGNARYTSPPGRSHPRGSLKPLPWRTPPSRRGGG